MAINPARFPRRPGIFQEEINESIRQTPIVETTNQLVLGFSKTGPRNTPVEIRNQREREQIFGPIDRNAEKKGSFFHRTIDNLVGNGTVIAINLLISDDNLDELSYKSVSTSYKVNNKETDKSGISRFFNKNGFWERDTEALLTVANQNVANPQHILHFVNHSDRKISVFAYKSDINGFNITAREWYSSLEQEVPSFMYPEEYISDYFIKVVVVAGDWSDYVKLQADPEFGQYFNSSGLIRTEVTNFYNNRQVEVLGVYDACLIPFFRDKQGRDYFIETQINADTDRTGLYCAFDTTLIESSDFPIGSVDLIGNGLLESGVISIDFLSYKENIQEQIEYPNQNLNRIGNVFFKPYDSLVTSFIPSRSIYGETDLTEGTSYNVKLEVLNGLTIIPSPYNTAPITSVQIGTVNPSNPSYYVIGGRKVKIADMLVTSVEVTPLNAGSNLRRVDVVVADASGTLQVIKGNNYSLPGAPTDLLPTVPADVIILGWIQHNFTNNGISSYHTVTANSSGSGIDTNIAIDFSPTDAATIGIGDYNSIVEPVDKAIITFNGTSNNISTVNQYGNINSYYQSQRTLRAYNYLKGSLLASQNPVFVQTEFNVQERYTKTAISSRVFTDSTVTNDARVELNFSSNIRVRTGTFTIYFNDDEFIMGSEKVQTIMTDPLNGLTPAYSAPITTGIVANGSKMYQDYVNGFIQNGDYFYDLRFAGNGVSESITIQDNVVISPTQVVDKIILVTPTPTLYATSFLVGQKIRLRGTQFNDGKDFTIINTLSGVGVFEIWVNEDVEAEISPMGKVFDATEIYLRFSLVGNYSTGTLKVEYFAERDLTTPVTSLNTRTLINGIEVYSYRANFKQTVDVDEVLAINKVVVDGARYGEILVGDFLEAFVDEDALEQGQVARHLARIIDKTQYAQDQTKVVLTTDIQIAVKSRTVGANIIYQTVFMKQLDTYVNTYNAMVLDGFKLRPESIPDGTEIRMNQFMSLFAPGTSMFNALTDRNKIDFRYLVDSFGLGLSPRSKQGYLDLLFKRYNAFGFLNMPSAAQFKKSNNPSFVNADGNLNVQFIADGADLSKNPAFRYSTGIGNGRSFAGYFFPYLKINDNGRPISFPPSSYVANAYMRKFTSTQGSFGVGTVIAGVDTGLITGITNVEIDLGEEDLEVLAKMGVNPIVFTEGAGFSINTEYTAETTPLSSVSYIHNRETLIELQKDIYNMLLGYRWKFNNPEVRSEIELAANEICQRYVRQGFLSNYRNIMNESNNTNNIIDNQLGVLSTFVELSSALERIVHQTTILRTGDIQLGNFAIAS
jgi:hypothetical protein